MNGHPEPPGRVVCLGDLMIDVLARLAGPLAVGSDSPAPITLLGGGSAANTAAWLVASGVPSTFVGRVGDDALGRLALAELTAAGIDLEVSVDPQRPTGTCIVLVADDGERTMVPSIGANEGLGAAELPDRLWSAGNRLHISGYAVFAAGSRPAAERAVHAAHAAHCPISVDAASAAPLRDFGAEAFLDWLPTGLLFANRDEAEVLTGAANPETAAIALAARCTEAIVKCGADGAVWSDGVRLAHVPAVPVELIDSTGAGDAFAAGVLAGRIAGLDVPGFLRLGTETAARAVRRPGARPSPPSPADPR